MTGGIERVDCLSDEERDKLIMDHVPLLKLSLIHI